MINDPNEMTFESQTFSVILYGPPGVGKTTLALSAPAPVLIDFDRGISRIKAEHRRLAKAVITLNSYEEVLEDLKSQVVADAQTIVIDTGGSFVTFLQDWAMRSNPTVNKQKNGAISLKGFGAVKSEFIRFTGYVRDVMNKNLIYVFHTEEKTDKDGNAQQRLMCEGAAKNIVWTPCDFGGYIQMIGQERRIFFAPEQEFFAKGCHGINGNYAIPALGPSVPNDLLTRIFDQAKANMAAENAEYLPLKEKYDAAIAQGKEIVAGVTDVETANAAMPLINGIEHALTSKKEIGVMFNTKIKELNLFWDSVLKKYTPAPEDKKEG